MPAEIDTLWQKGAQWLKEQGAQIVEISLPHTKYALPAYYIVAPAEASSNLARYDGVRYGLRVETEGGMWPTYKATRGKGFGEPVRLMLDMENDVDIIAMHIYNEDDKLLLAASNGKGFVIDAKDVVAQTKNGKQILNTVPGHKAIACVPANGDHVAVIGENRKLLIFPISQIPPMKKGQGVALQKYKDGTLADVKVFNRKEGLSWQLGGKVRVETDLKPWIGNRADAGRLPPTGFPRTNKFS